MKNPGCGFGCFGKLADMKSVGNINDLRIAQKEISEASQNHTIYRAILSVSKDTAEEHNLYDREEWEKLLRSNMSTIAMEMHIKQSDLRWAAAVHYKKDHPHVHIMYWDASKEPKREFVNQDQFKEVSDHVRASFAAKILHGEELKSLAVEKDSTVQATRKQLAALFLTANAAEALNIDKISPDKLDALGSEVSAQSLYLCKNSDLEYICKQLETMSRNARVVLEYKILEKK